jgi:hypothetical protein
MVDRNFLVKGVYFSLRLSFPKRLQQFRKKEKRLGGPKYMGLKLYSKNISNETAWIIVSVSLWAPSGI